MSSTDRCATGEVSEWLKEAVLKTVEPQGSGGSNPSLSGLKGHIYPMQSANLWAIDQK
jgi:hypothetical protein